MNNTHYIKNIYSGKDFFIATVDDTKAIKTEEKKFFKQKDEELKKKENY